MYIEAVPNRNSPPAILLRESYREDGKVRKRTLCNLSDWPTAHIEGLRGVLKGGTVIPAERDAFTVIRILPHGHVAAALGTARRIGLDRILGPDGNRCRDLVLALIVGRILDPASKLAAARALSPATAASSLGERCSVSARSMRTNSTPRSTGCWSASPPSRPRWPGAISRTARWCSTMCRRATWRAAAARSPKRGYSRDGTQRHAADRLWSALRARRLPRRHRGVRRQHRRSDDAGRPGREAQAALRASTTSCWSATAA